MFVLIYMILTNDDTVLLTGVLLQKSHSWTQSELNEIAE